ncbi:hypothetical protein K7432_008051 [Basidiobolus ranarum]|uniref:CBS domain-containing protein n=1 Tax=Basidiobolus ranarum TaxID=34480 RepID=A0ABR2VZ94_9FUNG
MTYRSISRRSNHQATTTSPDNLSLTETARSTKARRRVSKRDEAIRKKVEQELSRKKSIKSQPSKSHRGSGTVSSLRPQKALTVKENILVTEAAQLMAAKRMDSVLVVDEEEHLSGIFTSVDLAYKVISEGVDSRNTKVSEIMTRQPLCVTSDTNAIEALNTMTTKGFRHLPVCDLEGDVMGLLDITKCLLEVLKKMDRTYSNSKKLMEALEGVGKEWPIANSTMTLSMLQFMELLKEKIACPTLATLIDGLQPPEVTPKTSVRDAAKLMKKEKSTAVLVTEENQIVGIFTTKDIVLRVIAAGLDPSNCSVVRVMTPHPDCAPLDMTIVDALKKMNEGHFMNLPVVSEDGDVVGMLDVLKLTYATLEALNSMEHERSENNGDTIWSKLFNSFQDDDSQSVVTSGVPHAASIFTQEPEAMEEIESSPDILESHLLNTPKGSELYPHDSASILTHNESKSTVMISSRLLHSGMFMFKLRVHGVPEEEEKVHRVVGEANDLAALHSKIKDKLEMVNFETAYIDDEQDLVVLTTDEELEDAVEMSRAQGMSRLVVLVLPKDPWRVNSPDISISDSSPTLPEPEASLSKPSLSNELAFGIAGGVAAAAVLGFLVAKLR